MKLLLKITLSVFCMILISANSYAQDQKLEIILTVDVDDIAPGNLDRTCNFGQSKDISNEDFTTVVEIGDEVKWKIRVADSSKGAAKLIKYKHETGPKFFKKDSISARNNRIKGTIEEGAGVDGEIEKYTLEFKIKKSGTNEWINYAIDPKLKLSIQD